MKKITNYGFSLIEIMVALVISSFIIAAIYVTFSSQERTQNNQQQITEVMQNIRAAIHLMSNEIRLSGYDKSLNRGANAGIQYARSDFIGFTADILDDGLIKIDDTLINSTYLGDGNLFDIPYTTDPNYTHDPTDPLDPEFLSVDDAKKLNNNEVISYGFHSDVDKASDSFRLRGLVDSDNSEDMVLRRSTSKDTTENAPRVNTNGQIYDGDVLAERIQAVRFIYWYDDNNGNTGWDVDNNGDGVSDNSGFDNANIKVVRIGILGRTKNPLQEFTDTNTYDLDGDEDVNIDGDSTTTDDNVLGPFNDKYRRRLMVVTVKCRNMGLW